MVVSIKNDFFEPLPQEQITMIQDTLREYRAACFVTAPTPLQHSKRKEIAELCNSIFFDYSYLFHDTPWRQCELFISCYLQQHAKTPKHYWNQTTLRVARFVLLTFLGCPNFVQQCFNNHPEKILNIELIQSSLRQWKPLVPQIKGNYRSRNSFLLHIQEQIFERYHGLVEITLLQPL